MQDNETEVDLHNLVDYKLTLLFYQSSLELLFDLIKLKCKVSH